LTEVISVRFRGGSKTYFFDPRGLQVRLGENVIVQTAQGLEFDDTGVIWWKDLRWDGESQTWRTDLDESWDRQFVSSIVEYFGGRLEGGRPPWRVRYEDRQMSMAEFLRDSQADQDAILELVLNTYRVLLTRAKSSVHIWFADPATREHVRTVMRI